MYYTMHVVQKYHFPLGQMIDSFADDPRGFKTNVESSANTSLVYMRLVIPASAVTHLHNHKP